MSEVPSNFTNDSAMMIAWERSLESARPDALFHDPFAAALASNKGEALSEGFGANAALFGLTDWPEFHKTWTSVRTKYIDDTVTRHASTGRFRQLVNLGAGMDTRAYRLPCYAAFTNGTFDVDMEVVNGNKTKIFAEYLGAPKAHSGSVHNVNLDFLSEETSLAAVLGAIEAFDESQPTVFICEGLIMYLGAEGKTKLIRDVSAVAAPGSVLVLQFMEDAKNNAPQALSTEEAKQRLGEGGWDELQFSRFGDESLNFGRFPTARFPPNAGFSFVVAVKTSTRR